MIKNILSLCAEGIVIDSVTNSLTIFNIIEEINTTHYPFIFPKLAALNVFSREAKDQDKIIGFYKIYLNKNEIGISNFELNFLGNLKARYILNIGGIPIDQSGDLVIDCNVNNQKVSSYKIPVSKVSEIPGFKNIPVAK